MLPQIGNCEKSRPGGVQSPQNRSHRESGADTVTAVARDRDPEWQPLDKLLADRARCIALLEDYFSPLDITGREGYTGSRFESLSGGGDRPDVADKFVADDLVAVSLLSVNVPARAALYLLDDATGSLNAALRAIPTDIELVEAEDNHIAAADQLWYEVRSLHDVGRTTTSKLVARKRPRLVPVQDAVTMAALGEPTRFTKPLREKLRAGLHQKLIEIRQQSAIPAQVAAIRVLDVLLWMAFHKPQDQSTAPVVIP